MSACPTCPICGQFAGFTVTGTQTETIEASGKDWPEETHRTIGSSQLRECWNGHRFPERKVVWK